MSDTLDSIISLMPILSRPPVSEEEIGFENIQRVMIFCLAYFREPYQYIHLRLDMLKNLAKTSPSLDRGVNSAAHLYFDYHQRRRNWDQNKAGRVDNHRLQGGQDRFSLQMTLEVKPLAGRPVAYRAT